MSYFVQKKMGMASVVFCLKKSQNFRQFFLRLGILCVLLLCSSFLSGYVSLREKNELSLSRIKKKKRISREKLP